MQAVPLARITPCRHLVFVGTAIFLGVACFVLLKIKLVQTTCSALFSCRSDSSIPQTVFGGVLGVLLFRWHLF